MSDNLKKHGKADRVRLNPNQGYEMKKLAEKKKLPVPLVTDITRREGPMRKDVEKKLDQMKRNKKK